MDQQEAQGQRAHKALLESKALLVLVLQGLPESEQLVLLGHRDLRGWSALAGLQD